MPAAFADPLELQNLLFTELSRMFGREVPLYDKSLLVNRVCNEAVVALLGLKYAGFALSAEQLERTSGERHGAIRIGRPDEYRWVAGYFAAFGMLPHNFYDMTDLGGKSQPVIATAFRSPRNPEHRVFTSLLMTDYFDTATQRRIESLLAPRAVFSARAQALIRKNEAEGGLVREDLLALIEEGTTRIFKWTGRARDYALYQELSQAGFKIAADIACFASHHLNHLTPNTLAMDLYTNAMKFCLGEIPAEMFIERAQAALEFLAGIADGDWMRLHFKHLNSSQIRAFNVQPVVAGRVRDLVRDLAGRLQQPDLALSRLPHSGFKDFTEGPPADTPILLRQDSYKALTEPVQFSNPDGTVQDAVHTARFGEIEQRFYATTPKGRALYDDCLAQAEKLREADPQLIKRDYAGYLREYARCFARFPKTLAELRARGLVYVRYAATEAGRAAARAGERPLADLEAMLCAGWLEFEGLRYEDFLPFSAAGIFASNLGQYGTKSTARLKPAYSAARLEEIMGRPIVDPNAAYQRLESDSAQQALAELAGP